MEVFRKDLEDAGYPATWIKDTSMDDILLKPGMKRLYALKWCLSKFDERIEKHLDVQDDLLEAALWEAVTKLLPIMSDGKKDREIFEGNGKNTDQITFWKKIFHVVHLSKLNEQPCDVNNQNDYNTERLKPREPINLLSMELKMASNDLTNSDQLSDKHNEIETELQRLKTEDDLIPIHSNATETSLVAAAKRSATEDLDSKLESMQISFADYRNAYASKLQGLVEKTEISEQRITNNNDVFYGAVSTILSKLTILIDVHKDILKMRNEHLQFMQERNKRLRATLENGENKLKEMRMMVSALNDLNLQ